MAKDKYIVTAPFKDLEDDGKVYEKGDRYPRPANKKISKERLEELATTKSKRYGVPFITVEATEEDEKESNTSKEDSDK